MAKASYSASWTPPKTGSYYWTAAYSGDTNYTASATTCATASELVTVSPSAATLSTTPAPTTGKVGVKGTFGDTATVTGLGGVTPTGTVQFILYQGSGCTGAQLTSGLVALVAGKAPAAKASYSASWTPPKTGSYYWTAAYSGDTNYTGSATACATASELVTVSPSAATISTTPAPTTGNVGVTGTFGDTATVTGLGGVTPTGTVKFILYQGSGCTGAQLTSGQIALVAGTAPAASAGYSASWTPPKTGKYYWTAAYSGDTNYTSSSTTCATAGELVTVSPSAVTISTSAAPSTGTVGVKGTFGDTATVTGLGSVTPTGTVKFILYQGATCTGAQLTSGKIALVAGIAPAASAGYSASWTPPKTGNYYWTAVYSGDTNYTGSSTTCAEAGELVTVGSATTTAATTITQASSSRGNAGAIGTFGDTATVSGIGGVTPTGTVQFILYQGAGCTGVVELNSGQVALVAGAAMASASFAASWTPPTSGNYYWTVVYSGDANYTGSATTCTEVSGLETVS